MNGISILEVYDFGYEYKTRNLINPIEHFKGGPKACKKRCSATQGCKAFTWIRVSIHRRKCVLKKNDGFKIKNTKAVSGAISKSQSGNVLLIIYSFSIFLI